MTQGEIEALTQKVSVTIKPQRPFVCKQPTAPAQETQPKIVLAAITVFGRMAYMTAMAPKEDWHLHFNE